MARPPVIMRWDCRGSSDTWEPTTLDRLSKGEDFLEDALAASPDLLGLETRRSGIHGPFRVFRQVELTTPSGRTVYPDIVILAASGHVIVVEVKRHANSELRDREVIAQIIDYASSFAALPEEELLALFGSGAEPATWAELVAGMFPKDHDADELAVTLRERIRHGELNLVIACDKVPIGLPEIVAGIAAQSALGFDLDLVEVTPFVRGKSVKEIILVPSIRLSTEIIARTAVTVTYRQGDQTPSVKVAVTPPRESPHDLDPIWTPKQVEQEIIESGKRVAIDLLQFAKEQSYAGQFVPEGRRQNAVVAFYLVGRADDGSRLKRLVFSCVNGWNAVYLYLDNVRRIASPGTLKEFRRRLKQLFGDDLDVEGKVPGMGYDALDGKVEEFKQLMLWLKSKVSSPSPRS